jgi:hypothetical protein
MSLADHSLLTSLYDETIGFRRLTGTPYSFDVQQYERYYLVRVARSLYYVSPIIRKMVDKPLMLFFENGLDIEFESSKIENAFREYVSILPYNYSFDTFLELMLRAYCIDGELFLPLIEYKNGGYEFGYIPADMVLNVYHDENNGLVFSEIEFMKPDFSKDAIGSYYDINGRSLRKKIARVSKTKKEIRIDGEVLYFAINNFPFMRGRSIIETIMDYAYAYDEFVTDRLRRQKLANTYVWDVTLEGAERETIRRRIEEFRREPLPNSGGIRFHNEKEKWQIITPQLQSEDAYRDSQMILSHIANGMSVLSRAELGVEKSTPEETELVSRYINYIINRIYIPFVETVVNAVLYSCQQVGLLPKYNVNLEFCIGYRKYHTEMIRHIAVSLYQTSSALKVARERGWIDDENARAIIGDIVNKKIPENKRIINISEMNGIITTIARALELGLIDEEKAREVIEHYADIAEFEWLGGSKSIDLRGRITKGKESKPNLPVAENY